MNINKTRITGFFDSIQDKFEKNKRFRIFIFFIAVIIFCFIYIQAPLYRSNQHTKFLHGLAKADYGYLKNDWLAKTIDPLPVFSFLVYFTVKFLNEYIFYLYFSVILSFYIYSLFKILSDTFGFNNSFYKNIILFTAVALMHSTIIFDSISNRIFNYRFIELFIEEGVAGQYIIGRDFQPCVFGVFLIFSIYLFLKNRPFSAVIFLALSSTFHTAYLFSSGILTLSYMIIIYKEERKITKPFLIGLFSFLLILPVTIHYLISFKATTPELSKNALDILVNVRIPHHADPRVWLDFSVYKHHIGSYIRAILIIIATFIIRKKRMFIILLIPFSVAFLSTILQLFINNDFIGFLAPWRVTVWLVPVSTCIILTYMLSLFFKRYEGLNINIRNSIIAFCLFILFMHFIGGLFIVIKNFKLYLNKDHGTMMNYVNDHKSETDTYLIPEKMQEFRIDTGVPVLVSYKSHPYKDFELIEWYERLKASNKFYEKNNDDKCGFLKKIKSDYNVTHVILTKDQFDLKYDCLKELYKDEEYGVYRIEF